MDHHTLRMIWTGIMLVALAVTSPTWLSLDGKSQSGYDAPWVYPSKNPSSQN